MTSFLPAERVPTPVIIGIAGPPGSGKTLSSLRVARGLVGPGGKIAGIDTEHGRMTHYADRYQFDRAELEAPYSPDRYLKLMKEAAEAGYGCIIVDSASHMHDGEGGILEMQLEEHKRMGGRDGTKFASWIKPKAEVKKVFRWLEQAQCHVILCFRAQEKIAMIKTHVDGKDKTVPTPMGWQPITTKGLDYIATSILVLPPGSEGVPDIYAEARKMPLYLRTLFDESEQLSEDTGRKLAAWARNEKPVIPKIDDDRWEQAKAFASDEGKTGVAKFAASASEEEKAAIRLRIKELAALYPKPKEENENGE